MSQANTGFVTLPLLKEIGYITKKVSHHEKAIWIHHYLGRGVAFDVGFFIFIEMHEDCLIPFEVLGAESISPEQMKVTISDYEDIFEPHTASKKNVWIENQSLARYASPDALIVIEGFDLFNQHKYLGVVKSEVYTKAGIRMLLVEKEQEEMYIPYLHEMLLSLDIPTKKMVIQLPVGTTY